MSILFQYESPQNIICRTYWLQLANTARTGRRVRVDPAHWSSDAALNTHQAEPPRPAMETSAHPMKFSWGPQPSFPVPSGQVPQLFPALYRHWKQNITRITGIKFSVHTEMLHPLDNFFPLSYSLLQYFAFTDLFVSRSCV